MPNFSSPDGELTDVFMTDSTILQSFIGNRLFSWGANYQGPLGDNTSTSKSYPVQTVSAGTNWKLVACGGYHTAAIKTDGTLWLWGRNLRGQLGNNTNGDVNNKSSPIQTISGGTNWQLVSCGPGFTGAIKTDGTLWMWGSNSGELGDNTFTSRSSPVQTVSGGTNWKQVACGYSHTGAIKTDGTLWMWGSNASGELGDNTQIDKPSPVQTVSAGTNWSQVACGSRHTAAIKTDGTLWLWGRNYTGQLGDNTRTHRSSPVQTVSGGTNWKQVACAKYFTGAVFTAAIKTDGTLWTWGHNYRGQLGNNNSGVGAHKSSPVQTVAGGTNWKLVSCGDYHAVAIKTDGTLWGWGRNISGQLGDNTTTSKSSPVQTAFGGTNWKQFDCGGDHNATITYDES